MKPILTRCLFALCLLPAVLSSCKRTDCYNEQLYQLHKNDNCPANCPGVTGCDGKTYCNECEAKKQGFYVKK